MSFQTGEPGRSGLKCGEVLVSSSWLPTWKAALPGDAAEDGEVQSLHLSGIPLLASPRIGAV